MQEETNNFLFKYLVLELFEKLYRLKKYIGSCEKLDKNNNNKRLIELFNESINYIGTEIDELCSVIDADLSSEDKFTFILSINKHSLAIKKIHEELKNLHSTWILPEIKTFSKEIISKGEKTKNDINIILSDHYTFLERNLSQKFQSSLESVYGGGKSDLIIENHSFILPKIEFSNPLNWTIIVHEAGHLQSEIIQSIRNNPDIIPDNISTKNEIIIKNWAEEIYCDIFATSILGPAYFISFVSFALLSPLEHGISTSSEMHPSVIVRALIMMNYLKDNNLVFKSDWEIEDYTKIFSIALLEQNSILDEDQTNKIEGLTKFNTNLRKIIKNLDLNSFSIDKSDSVRIKNLLDNLQNGIPIGSTNIDEFSIEYLKEIQSKKTLTVEELENLKKSVSERSCEIWEILNTGWLFKLKNCFEKGESIFFIENEIKIMTKIEKYGEIIDFLDDRLLASINSSQILKIIEDE